VLGARAKRCGALYPTQFLLGRTVTGLRRIRETERFQARLAEVVRREEIPNWLDATNDAFRGLKPLEVIERGEIDRLWNMIYYLDSGVTS
jgi:hypothetical protein